MEHILQFAVSIDENAIVKRATEKASEKILESVKSKINSYTQGWQTKLDAIFKVEVEKVVSENKEQIIAAATKQLVDNMSRTKAVKEAVKKVGGDA